MGFFDWTGATFFGDGGGNTTSSQQTTEETKDQRTFIEGDQLGLYLSPESTYEPVYHGNVSLGLSGEEVSDVLEEQAVLTESIAGTMKEQTDKLAHIIETMKSPEGVAYQKLALYGLLGFVGYMILKRVN